MYVCTGKCQCRDVASCPTTIKDCACPPGLFRICERCEVDGILYTSTPEATDTPGAMAMCRDDKCQQWGCSCFNYNPPWNYDPASREDYTGPAYEGTFGQEFETDKYHGESTCLVDNQGLPKCEIGQLITEEYECCAQLFPPSFLKEMETNDQGKEHRPPLLCGITSCCLNLGDAVEARREAKSKEGTHEVIRSVREPPKKSPRSQMASLRLAGIDKDAHGLLIAAGLDLETLQMMMDDRTYLAAELREAGIAKPGDRAKIINALLTWPQIGPDGTEHLSDLAVPSAASKPTSVLRRDMRRVGDRRGETGQAAAGYGGGYVLLKLLIEFEAKDNLVEDFDQMLLKCPDSQVSSCPEGHDAADYQTYEFQEKFFSDSGAGALNSVFPGLNVEIEKVEAFGFKSFYVYFRISGQLDNQGSLGLSNIDRYNLLDLSDGGISKTTILTNEVDIANNARCCGQTADRKADNPPVNPPTITEWSGCAAECTDPRDENPSCDDQELCVRTVGLMTLSKFSTGQGPEQQETFELIPYVCGDKFQQRTNLDIGLRWQDIGTTQPTEGRLITNVALANALQSRTEFDQDELNAFGIADLRENDYIRSTGSYFIQKAPEDCDLGYDYNSYYSTCSDGTYLQCDFDGACTEAYDEELLCRCNEHKGFTLDPVSQTCVCGQNAQPSAFVASESTQMAVGKIM